jgi:hypothetical protein
LSGCDFVEFHFEALNTRNIYFKGDAMISLGLRSHEPLVGKNAHTWENNNTCVNYNELEQEMFFDDMELSQAEEFFTKGLKVLLVSTLVIAFNTMIAYFMPNYFYYTILYLATAAIFASASLQRIGYESLDIDLGICDHDRYSKDAWYEKYPLQDHPEYKYMNFFAECKLGETSKLALSAIKYQYVACIWIAVITGCTVLWHLGHWLNENCRGKEYNSVAIFSPSKKKSKKKRTSTAVDKKLQDVDESIDDDDASKENMTVVTSDDGVDEESIVSIVNIV